MATAGALEAQFLRDIPELTKGSVHLIAQTLRKAGLMPRGPSGPGAPHLEAKHAAAFLFAIASGVSVSSVVQATHALMDIPRRRWADNQFEVEQREILDGLKCATARTSGDAFAGILHDMRSGAYAKWGGQVSFVQFDDTLDELSLTANHPTRGQRTCVVMFARKNAEKPMLHRRTYIDERLLLNLAAAMDR